MTQMLYDIGDVYRYEYSFHHNDPNISYLAESY